MMVGVCLSICRMPQPNSKMERPRITKIGMMEDQYTGYPRTNLEFTRSKFKVTRPINAVPDNSPYAGRER